jgi:DNA polymerase
MDETLRRQYLAAMGIQGWVRRLPDDLDPGTSPPREEPLEGTPDPVVRPIRVEQDAPNPRAGLAEISHPETGDVVEPFAAATTSPPIPLPKETARLDWDALRQRVLSCTACGLSETRTQAVFGVGDREADLLVIGEAPGADEDRQGEPFVGRAGQLLNAMLKGIGLSREQVYIANILKCRPPGNRDPGPEEALRCEPFLMRQIELIGPRAILSVGRISAQHLLKTDTPVGRLRGKMHEFGENRIPLVVTYHPAYLLRSPEQKAKAWQDLLLVHATLRDKGS